MLKALTLMKMGSFFDPEGREIDLPAIGPTIKRAIPGARSRAEAEPRLCRTVSNTTV